MENAFSIRDKNVCSSWVSRGAIMNAWQRRCAIILPPYRTMAHPMKTVASFSLIDRRAAPLRSALGSLIKLDIHLFLFCFHRSKYKSIFTVAFCFCFKFNSLPAEPRSVLCSDWTKPSNHFQNCSQYFKIFLISILQFCSYLNVKSFSFFPQRRLVIGLTDWFINWYIDPLFNWLVDWLIYYKGKSTYKGWFTLLLRL